MTVELLPFQKEAQLFVLKRKASLLALATGLGKTITSISAVDTVINKYPETKCIYVTENSILCQSVEDIEKHFDLKITQIYKLTPKERKEAYKDFVASSNIMVMNYHILIRDIKLLQSLIVKHKIKLISIFDEANNIRRETSQFHQCARALSKLSYKTVALTATPTKQKLDDIYNTLKAINIEPISQTYFTKNFEILADTPTLIISYLGKVVTQIPCIATKGRYSVFRFKIPFLKSNIKKVILPDNKLKIRTKNSEGAFELGAVILGMNKSFMKVETVDDRQLTFELLMVNKFQRLGFKNTNTFMQKVSDYIFVKSKRSVCDTLPRFTLQKRLVDEDKLSKQTITMLYEKTIKDVEDSDEPRAKFVNYAQILISQNTPQSYNEQIDFKYKTEKIKEVFKILENDVEENDKVVIYSPWRKSIDILYCMLLDEYCDGNTEMIAKISGGDDTDNNEERVRFQTNPNCKILLLTDAGTRGLNLQVANHLIFLNMPRDAGDYDQVGGRLPRVGTKHTSLSAYFIIAEETIDQDHYEMVMRNYMFMRELHSEFGDESLQDTNFKPLDLKNKDEFLFKKLENRKKQYIN